jgi:putative tricarboxylic transport membrane protein
VENVFQNLALGFSVALTPQNLMFAFIGVLIGQVIGALPGIGASAGLALLLPITFGMNPTSAIIMLAGITYGTAYGGTITSVLVNVPGEASSVMTAVDGYQMAKQGRAGAALGIAALGSFIAGTISLIFMMFLAPSLSRLGTTFSASEYFLLALLGLTAIAGFGSSSQIKALMMGLLGLMLALVGIDPLLGDDRFTFGHPNLADGVDFLPVAIGIFGIAEVLVGLEHAINAEPIKTRLRDLWPTARDWLDCRWTMVRGTVLGFLIGVAPGTGPTVASFLCYLAEKKASRQPEKFGKGAIEGVCAAETANNAAATGALVPMLTLGIPGSAAAAVLMAAFILHGLRPGPLLMQQQPQVIWGVIASMYIGNVMLVILNMPLAPMFAALLRIPYAYLAPVILAISLVGAFAAENSMFNVGLALVAGVFGYIMMKTDLPRAPLVLGLVLGPLIEQRLRQALTISLGNPLVLVQRPISAVLLAVVVLSLLWPYLPFLLRPFQRRRQVPVPAEA